MPHRLHFSCLAELCRHLLALLDAYLLVAARVLHSHFVGVYVERSVIVDVVHHPTVLQQHIVGIESTRAGAARHQYTMLADIALYLPVLCRYELRSIAAHAEERAVLVLCAQPQLRDAVAVDVHQRELREVVRQLARILFILRYHIRESRERCAAALQVHAVPCINGAQHAVPSRYMLVNDNLVTLLVQFHRHPSHLSLRHQTVSDTRVGHHHAVVGVEVIERHHRLTCVGRADVQGEEAVTVTAYPCTRLHPRSVAHADRPQEVARSTLFHRVNSIYAAVHLLELLRVVSLQHHHVARFRAPHLVESPHELCHRWRADVPWQFYLLRFPFLVDFLERHILLVLCFEHLCQCCHCEQRQC